jgi:para-nitrobenzyl esterase
MLELQAEATAAVLADFAAIGLIPKEPSPSEDCLFLNVWRPAGEGARRPVVVWFHGGGYVTGSAAAPLYNFANLVRRGDIVAVGVNHRLGAFGYLNLAELLETEAESANVGTLDLVAALEWVRDNIAAFGGDPGNVTVFGSSGGAHKVSMLFGMPEAAGLYHRAMLMSVADPGKARSLAETTQVAEALLIELGLTHADADALRAVPMKILDGAQAALFRRESTNPWRQVLLFLAVFDGLSVPSQPIDALAAGISSDVPILIGTTRDEVANPMPLRGDIQPNSEQFLRSWLDDQIGDAGYAIAQAYRAIRAGTDPTGLVRAIVTDHFFRIPSIRFADAALAGGNQVHMYLFTQPDPRLGDLSPHAWELPFFFDNVDLAPAADIPGGSELAARTADALIAFARHGDPGHGGLPEWPAYSVERRSTMVFENNCHVIDDPQGAERQAWDDVEAVGLIHWPTGQR